MKLNIRTFRRSSGGLELAASLLAAFTFCMPSSAGAAAYPDHKVQIVVAQEAGGGVDTLARLIAKKLSTGTGTSFYVQNRPGANGIIGAQYVARSKADGYTVLMAAPTMMTVNQFVYKNLPYRPFHDFAPVTQITRISFGLVVNKDLPVHNVQDLIALAKREPGKLNYGSGGVGNLNQLGAELFSTDTGTHMQLIPQKGEGPAIIDLVAGRTSLMFATMPSAAPQVTAGRLRLLAIAGKSRSSVFPHTPTLVELGFPNITVQGWAGMVVPAHTPAHIVETLQKAVAKALRDPEVRQSIVAQGAEPVGSTPAQFQKFMRAEAVKWHKVVDILGLKAG